MAAMAVPTAEIPPVIQAMAENDWGSMEIVAISPIVVAIGAVRLIAAQEAFRFLSARTTWQTKPELNPQSRPNPP